jgi:hypothetical protein
MRNGKWTIWLFLTWLFTGILLAFFNRPIDDALWIIAGFIYLAFLLLGLVLFITTAILAYRNRNIYALAAAASFIVLGGGLLFVAPALSRFGNDLIVGYRFRTHHADYDRITSMAISGKLSKSSGEIEGVRYEIDKGSTIRVAFPQPGGILDNWEGIIYDPTGEVLKAKGWVGPEPKFSAPPEIVSLFGGQIVSCSHLLGDYYRCWFT